MVYSPKPCTRTVVRGFGAFEILSLRAWPIGFGASCGPSFCSVGLQKVQDFSG